MQEEKDFGNYNDYKNNNKWNQEKNVPFNHQKSSYDKQSFNYRDYDNQIDYKNDKFGNRRNYQQNKQQHSDQNSYQNYRNEKNYRYENSQDYDKRQRSNSNRTQTDQRRKRSQSPTSYNSKKFNTQKGKLSRSRSRSREQKKAQKTLKFQQDDKIVEYKYFYCNDEPTSKGVSLEEVQEKQQLFVRENKSNQQNSYYHSSEQMKKMESLMEANKFKQQKENYANTHQNIYKEQILWYKPLGCYSKDKQEQPKVDSQEKFMHQKRIDIKLSCFYVNEQMIPETPTCNNIINNILCLQNPKQILIDFDVDRMSEQQAQKIQIVQQQESQKDTRKLKPILKKSKEQILQEKELERKLKKERDEQERIEKEKKEKEEQQYKTIDPAITHKLVQLIEQFKKDQNSINEDEIQNELKSIAKQLQNKDPDIVKELFTKIKQLYENAKKRQDFPQNNPMPMQNYGQFNMNPNYAFVPQPSKFKTVPCRFFQTPQGCPRADGCHFIHQDLNSQQPILQFNQNNILNPKQQTLLNTQFNQANLLLKNNLSNQMPFQLPNFNIQNMQMQQQQKNLDVIKQQQQLPQSQQQQQQQLIAHSDINKQQQPLKDVKTEK